MRKILDNIGTICWFLMDACWMLDWTFLSVFFMILAGIIFMGLLFPNKNIQDRTIEFLISLSTSGWFLMNSAWMLDEIYKHSYSEGFML